MKPARTIHALYLVAAFGISGTTAKACDFDFENGTDAPIAQLRLYNSADHYLGLGDPGPLLKGDKFRFTRRRVRRVEAAWPDTCDEKVYISFIIGRPGERTVDDFGGQQCHIKEQIRRPMNATLEVDNRHLIVVTTRDLLTPGACRDR